MRTPRLGLFRRRHDRSSGMAPPGDGSSHGGSPGGSGTTAAPVRRGERDRGGAPSIQDGGRAVGATGTGTGANGAAVAAVQGNLPVVAGVRTLPRPALRWVGSARRIALREFDFVADADAVCSFQEETYSVNFPEFRYTESFATAFRHDLRRASLDPQHGVFVLDEGTVVGFLWLVVCQNTWTNERYGYINNLFVRPQRRGAGLAAELMEHADAFFRSRHIKRVRLTVTAANAAAVRLYANCGYLTTRWEMEKDL